MKNIFALLLIFINLSFAYENITIEDGYSFIYKDNNCSDETNSTQIYINYYDKNNNLDGKNNKYYGHIFTQGNVYTFSDVTPKEDENKTIFNIKTKNISVKANVINDRFEGVIKLNNTTQDINASLDKKYSLIMITAKANFEQISQRDFIFKKSFVYDAIDFKDQNSSQMRFKMANLLKNSYLDELSNWYNEFFASNNVNFNSPTFIRYNNNLENIYYKKGNLTVFLTDEYFYSGGAHDNTSKQYEVNYKEKKLELSDILKDVHDQNLISMIWDKVKVYAYIKQNDLEISKNFSISPYGITFVYNPYEIGPFSAGIIEAFFKFSEIKPFLKDEFLSIL
ncbi:Protein of uncharacterised function (DUF3298) [Campylobacter sputorum subsp. bubulus]|uniref:RsiV family protein n=1 Tax=Campylobacter sputorum TaxID=206 RepID=UPI000E151172|nr:RsiV family protein [Campylobacter sputorum]ASM35420.1 DUF3298 domain protein [Campylobacter sputorum aubsp. sputorum RM3237]QEL05612.1 DUF3298 domain-containing protein [Campylobacter sputorum subsp. sputorum]SUX08518.1 Protein of uncharacterised function (DUF3298) [Campylobacter sputorum subsp. bubulus]